MNYTQMLNELIASSGKLVKDIADECSAEYGVNLTRVYLSNLKTQDGRIPSEDISRALAKVCGSPYEEILVIQAYLDRAPKEIIQFLEGIQAMLSPENAFDADDPLNELLAMEAKKPLAQFICEYAPQMEILKKGFFETVKEVEPKWIVISPKQVKEWSFVDESAINKLLKS